MKENCLLAHDSGKRAQCGEPDLPGVDTIEQNAPTRRLIKSWNQIDEGALARAAGPDQRDHFAFAGGEIDVSEDRSFSVREGDFVETQITIERGFVARPAVALKFGRGIEDLEQSLG